MLMLSRIRRSRKFLSNNNGYSESEEPLGLDYGHSISIINSTPSIFISKTKKSKYVILNDYELIDNVLSILNQWKISRPKLIVSVTGGAGQFALPSRIKTAFKYGIAKVAESTDALIITGF
jgi:hypothetical protein